MDNHELRETAIMALPLVDLTNLKDDCTPDTIAALCRKAQTPFGNTAAVCIWPRFVAQARAAFGPSHPVRVATVVNFPSGSLDVEVVVAETRRAIADGANEIDLVIPYTAMIAGDEQAVRDMVDAVRVVVQPPVLLKTILETGMLKDTALIRRAAEIAIEAGSDFIKTSTGKVAVNATLEAADIMLRVIRHSRRNVGFKPAGGISSVAEAALYLRLADTIMGPDWVMPSTFRFGASGLLDDILSVLGDGKPLVAVNGY